MDIVVALVPSLLFGALSLLLGAFPTDTRRQNTAVMVGAGVVSLVCSALLGVPWSPRATVWGAACGLMWTGGQVFVLRAFRAWGVSRTMPLTTALQLLLNATLGVSLFGEWRAPGALALGSGALALIMVGAAACSWQERTGPGPTSAQRRDGLLATLASAVLYGSYPSLLRAVHVPSAHAVGPMGLGLLAGAVLCALVLPRSSPLRGPRIAPAALAGGLWAIGNALMLRSTAAVGVASGFTLSQLGFVLATVGGLTILGERRTGRERVVVAGGVVAAVVGLVLMGLATSMDSASSSSG
ncbi:GRP family sugar transporter [Actinomyces sp. ZJ308]|uniref:GRP family sugar transporter n=1 Tax=Actinomyces sp. ZJ308 TaxID=2708342 RepID=UPI001421E31C|nr:GRP family sugar transporter [Actinomyces sp. ZJ308]